MKKRILFLLLFSLIICVISNIIVFLCAKKITTNVYYFNTYDEIELLDTNYISKNNKVKLKDVYLDEKIVKATFIPKDIGFDIVTFYTKTTNSLEDAYVDLKFLCGPFNTIFYYSPHIDFNGSNYVIYILMFTTFIYAFVFLYSFIEYIKKSKYGYGMVVAGGAGLFFLLYLISSTQLLIQSMKFGYLFGFGHYVAALSNSGWLFTQNVSVLFEIFIILLIISNISLICHEGFKPSNLLGVILGVLWIIGSLITYYFVQKSFNDIFFVYTTISNASALIISYFECLLFSITIAAYFASRRKTPYDMDYVIILGCALRRDGSLNPLLKGRVDAALNFSLKQLKETGKQVKFIPSGGKGNDEIISEGEAIKNYLIEQGIDKKYILPEVKSRNTYENLKFSKEIIEHDTNKKYNVAFATTNYHIFRGYIISHKLNLKNIYSISAKTKWYFYPNAFIREWIGLFVDKWKVHLIILLIIVMLLTGIYFTLF